MKHAIPQRACSVAPALQAEPGEQLLRAVRLSLILLLITYLSDGESGTVTIDGTYAGQPLRPTVE